MNIYHKKKIKLQTDDITIKIIKPSGEIQEYYSSKKT